LEGKAKGLLEGKQSEYLRTCKEVIGRNAKGISEGKARRLLGRKGKRTNWKESKWILEGKAKGLLEGKQSEY